MMGSIRLFLASLFIAQLSGVVGSRSDNGHNRKDQLRGHGREENRKMKEEVKHATRSGEASAIRSKDQTNKADTTERDLQAGNDNGFRKFIAPFDRNKTKIKQLIDTQTN
jgi:hypothetical protein